MIFLPVAFMGGILGPFFYSFGLTIAFSLAVLLLVLFTLTPMLASRRSGNVPRTIQGPFGRYFLNGVQSVFHRSDSAEGSLLARHNIQIEEEKIDPKPWWARF